MLLIYLQGDGGDLTGLVGAIAVILVIVLIAVNAGKGADEKTKALEKAKNAYQNSLTELKANPTNPDLRQVTVCRRWPLI